MKNISKLVTKGVILSMILSSGVAMAASGDNVTYKNVTLEERLYQYDGYGAKWGLDVGNDGLWFVPKQPIGDTYNAPFKVRNNTLDNTLVVGSNVSGMEGNVGIGTDTPSVKLDVQWSGSNTVGDGLTNLLVLSADNSEADKASDAGFRLVNGSTSKGWNFRTSSGGDAFQATLQGTGGAEFTVKNATSNISGTELHLGNGAKNIGGLWINASSRARKENIKELSTQDALAAFHKLQPVTYNYKSDKKEQVVGFIAEDVPELVAIQSRDGLSAMDMVAVLTKVVQEQDKVMVETRAELQAKDAEMETMKAEIAKLKVMQKKVAQLESILTNLALDTSKSKKEKISVNLK
ncbi:tail fiber domain-containing protein [Sulfurovum sp. CS9]|uniref:tail fiber domain-containing protein n=1 Tax=Sulfurovum sp. CS9 TaxID=3391146 RepID=UPI0039EBF9AA